MLRRLLSLVVMLSVLSLVVAQTPEKPKGDAPGTAKLEKLEALEWQNFLLKRTLLKEQIGKYEAQVQALSGALRDGREQEQKVDADFNQKWQAYAKKFQLDPEKMQYKAETGEFSGPVVVPKSEPEKK